MQLWISIQIACFFCCFLLWEQLQYYCKITEHNILFIHQECGSVTYKKRIKKLLAQQSNTFHQRICYSHSSSKVSIAYPFRRRNSQIIQKWIAWHRIPPDGGERIFYMVSNTSKCTRNDRLFMRNEYDGRGKWKIPLVKKQDLNVDNLSLIACSDTNQTILPWINKMESIFS